MASASHRRVVPLLIGILLLRSLLPAEAAGIQRLSTREIDALEARAEAARRMFHAGDYMGAAAVFEAIAQPLTVSTPLYLSELASCRLAMDDWDGAQHVLRQVANMLEGFFDETSERAARSFFDSESRKLFKGEPFERSLVFLFLGLTFLRGGDVDNALACFKNGILLDADVTQDLYKCDIALLHALEAWCYRQRRQETMKAQSLTEARDAFVITHPRVRAAAGRAFALPSQPRADPAAVAAAAARLDERRQAVNTDYIRPLLSVRYNTLVLIWSGRAPNVQRAGPYGEIRALVLNPPVDDRYEVRLGNGPVVDALQGLYDVSFQATTRGGRLMDNVLRDQAAFKGFTSSLGDSLINSSRDVGGVAGLIMIGAGLISKGVSAATNPAADIRQWGCLPDTLQVTPMLLAEGRHELVIEEYAGFSKVGERRRTFDVADAAGFTVVLVMPNPTVGGP